MLHTIATEYDLPIRVDYRITARAQPARSYGPPERCYPPEPAEYEIERVLICGVPIPLDKLPEAVGEGIEEQIEIDIGDAIEGEDAAAEEFRAEARRDGE